MAMAMARARTRFEPTSEREDASARTKPRKKKPENRTKTKGKSRKRPGSCQRAARELPENLKLPGKPPERCQRHRTPREAAGKLKMPDARTPESRQRDARDAGRRKKLPENLNLPWKRDDRDMPGSCQRAAGEMPETQDTQRSCRKT